MIESVHCPNCRAHYALRPSRVERRHRRALCFNCDQVFPIQEEIQRLFQEEDLFSSPEEATITAEQPLVLSDAIATMQTGPLPGIEYPVADTPQPMPEAHYPLTLGDLDEPDSSMERTLILNPAGHSDQRGIAFSPSHSAEELEALGLGPGEPSVTAHQDEPPEESDGTSTYSSARDAIDKLLAGTPTPQRIRPMSMGRPGTPMDVESTLDALELTLGGAHLHPSSMEEDPGSTAMLSHHELDRAMISVTAEPEPSASTQLLNIADIPLPPPPPMEATLRMARPILEPPPFRPISSPALQAVSTIPVPAIHSDGVQDPNLLKVQLEQDTLSNVGMDQLVQMVEQGQVKEYHLVARQFSENWLEASKVPALRPVFERLRRATQMGPVPTLSNETAPVKRSLFGGLFGGKS